MGVLAPRVVLVHRHTELDELLVRHGSRGQAEFFLRSRGMDIASVEERHVALREALREVGAAVPLDWRRAVLERADVDRFTFDPTDIVVVVGQDGLVANVAKSLNGQLVIGFNPDVARHPGVLVRHAPGEADALLSDAASPGAHREARSMVQATADDGQTLIALNEIFVGHPSHQSARYTITADGQSESQSSSGVIIGTGTGATGWLQSVHRDHHSQVDLPHPEEAALAWFVREAWQSPTTGTTLVEGRLAPAETLQLRALADGLVVFGDGMEGDRLTLAYSQRISVGLATQTLNLG